MSTQAVTEFIAKNAKNPPPISGESKEERLATLVELGNNQGFDFTAEECVSILEAARKHKEGELSDAQLEAVAGGADGEMKKELPWYEEAALWFNSLFREDGFEERDGTAVAGVRG